MTATQLAHIREQVRATQAQPVRVPFCFIASRAHCNMPRVRKPAKRK